MAFSPEEGFEEALRRINACRESRAETLELGGLQLQEVPEELLQLTWLKRLYLGGSKELRKNPALSDHTELRNAYRVLPDAFSSALAGLEELDLGYSALEDLAPLAGLTALTRLDCRNTQVSDLAPLTGLTALTQLNCSHTQVSDLAPITGLTALTELNCSHTQVQNLVPLTGLTALTELNCSHTQVQKLAPIAGLTALTQLACSYTQVSDLAPVAGLTALTLLECTRAQVSDLTPLAGLTALTRLGCSFSQVSDLAPLTALTALTGLGCSFTRVSDLTPLTGLTALTRLDCLSTQVSDLKPLAGLTALTWLGCSNTQVSCLAPLAGLTALTQLDCSRTRVSDLAPLTGLTALILLSCSGTPVSDLAPLAGLTALIHLDCSDTQVSDLAPLAGLTALIQLHCSGCRIDEAPVAIWDSSALKHVDLHDTRLPGIPEEVLSRTPGFDFLPALRAHLKDLGDAPEPLAEVKLMVLGNGRVGKTQVVRRLQDRDYQPKSASTHGVIVSGVPLDLGQDAPVTANVWDFGGQDLYHATHALFFRTRAIFLICWHPAFENQDVIEQDGFLFRNEKLPYWLNHVRQFAGARAPLILAQTRCDTIADEADLPDEAADCLKGFQGFKRGDLKTSAATGDGFGSLRDLLKRAYSDFNPPLIGAGRAAVKRELEARRARLEEARAHGKGRLPDALHGLRTMSLADFEALCREHGQISDPRLFLRFLHNAGTVFHQEDLLDSRIIIDQTWALDAIYAVFNRESSAKFLKQTGQDGRFSRGLLGKLLWDADYEPEEQRLFLSMMESCGICFRYADRSREGDPDGTTWIAPEFLPEAPKPHVRAGWPESLFDAKVGSDRTVIQAIFRSELTSRTLIRGIISDVGTDAGVAGEYWRDGVQVYDEVTGCLGLVEQRAVASDGDDGGAHIHVCVRPADATRGIPENLLESLSRTVKRTAQRYGIALTQVAGPDPDRRGQESEGKTFSFTTPPVDRPKHYVSYAWADDKTPAGKEREEKVDALCASYGEDGVHIYRDKSELRRGDEILKFMRALGASDRVFVFLSDKYLKSPFCMFELFELWRNARMDEEDFLARVRIFALDDADIWSLEGRAKYVAYWWTQLKKYLALFAEAGHQNMSDKSHQELRHMQDFAHRVDEILLAYTGRIQPRRFEEFLKHGFDGDRPGEGDSYSDNGSYGDDAGDN